MTRIFVAAKVETAKIKRGASDAIYALRLSIWEELIKLDSRVDARTKLQKEKSLERDLRVEALDLVEVTGFEPATSCSQSRRATNCATPRYRFVCFSLSATAAPETIGTFVIVRDFGAKVKM